MDTKEEIVLSDAQYKETIIKFLKEMASQDNRGTATPYFYVIRTEEIYVTGEGYSDEIHYLDESNERIDPKLIVEDEKDNEDLSSDPEKNADGKVKWASCHPVGKYWREEGMFLTETDAETHLKLNHYHYSSNAHTYVKYAFRAPRLEDFLNSLFKYFKVMGYKK